MQCLYLGIGCVGCANNSRRTFLPASLGCIRLAGTGTSRGHCGAFATPRLAQLDSASAQVSAQTVVFSLNIRLVLLVLGCNLVGCVRLLALYLDDVLRITQRCLALRRSLNGGVSTTRGISGIPAKHRRSQHSRHPQHGTRDAGVFPCASAEFG